jgi:demethylmenaquinone methyltransferase/2-methoxy-6-polyprenyl-1,4-benzoquinol methylase
LLPICRSSAINRQATAGYHSSTPDRHASAQPITTLAAAAGSVLGRMANHHGCHPPTRDLMPFALSGFFMEYASGPWLQICNSWWTVRQYITTLCAYNCTGFQRSKMTNLSGNERARYVQAMFSSIARRYDLMNRLMTGFQDVRWRREVIERAHLQPGSRLLDLGTGTGDLAREALSQQPRARVTAADFTLDMMRVGSRSGSLNWCAADALILPFRDGSFHSIVSGFLMRNVVDLQQAIREQYRLLKPGGHMVVLDTTRPRRNLLSPFIWLHMHVIIPLLGRLISGQADAYTYLPDSTEGFITAERLAAQMAAAGFKEIGYKRLMFGTIAIHWGRK